MTPQGTSSSSDIVEVYIHPLYAITIYCLQQRPVTETYQPPSPDITSIDR